MGTGELRGQGDKNNGGYLKETSSRCHEANFAVTLESLLEENSLRSRLWLKYILGTELWTGRVKENT